ncbi:MAG: hypothetical protein AAF809_06795 [Bacteroidota bacterium]
MPESKQHKKVVLNLDGDVSPAQFLRGVRDFFGVLKSVSTNVTGEKGGVRWSISVQSGSNLIIAEGHPVEQTSSEAVFRAVDAITGGFEALSRGTVEAPPFFTEKTLDLAYDLAQLAESGKKKGLDKVEIRVNGSTVPLSAQAAASVNAIRGKEYKALGSVEGRLQTVSDRRGFKFVVYDNLRDRPVECRFSDDSLLEDALGAFGRRVSVFGTVTYREDGTPIRVRVNRLRVFRRKEELPPPENARGLFNRAV